MKVARLGEIGKELVKGCRRLVKRLGREERGKSGCMEDFGKGREVNLMNR